MTVCPAEMDPPDDLVSVVTPVVAVTLVTLVTPDLPEPPVWMERWV